MVNHRMPIPSMLPSLVITHKRPNINHIPIKDNSKANTEKVAGTHYLLHFTSGKRTLPFFKRILFSPKVREIVVYVVNVERFEYVFRAFRDLHFNVREYDSVPSYRERYAYADRRQVFEPKLFDCAVTSLLRPDLYLSGRNASTDIVRELLDSRTGKQLVSSKELASLIGFGAVTETGKDKMYKTTF